MPNLKERIENLTKEFTDLSAKREQYISETQKIEARLIQIQGAVSELRFLIEEDENTQNIEGDEENDTHDITE